MAHNERANPDPWELDDDILPAHLEKIETNAVEAVNGDQGGAWAPVEPIVIGGAGLKARALYDHVAAGPNGLVNVLDVTTSRLRVLGAGITADRDYILSGTDAEDGDILEFLATPAMATGRKVTVKNLLLTTLATLGYTAGEYRAARFVFYGGAWYLLQGTPNPRMLASSGVTALSAALGATSETDVAGSAMTFTGVVAGNVLQLDAFGQLLVETHTGGLHEGLVNEAIRITKSDNTSIASVDGAIQASGAYVLPWALSARYVVTSGDQTAGSVAVKMRHQAIASTIDGALSVRSFRGLHLRVPS